MPLHIGRHVGRRHQANGVAKRLQLARPMMRRGTGFDANQARRQLLEERQNLSPRDNVEDQLINRAIHLVERECAQDAG